MDEKSTTSAADATAATCMDVSYEEAMELFEANLLRTRVALCGGNLTRARKSLRMSESTLWRRRRLLGLDVGQLPARRPEKTAVPTDPVYTLEAPVDTLPHPDALAHCERQILLRRLALNNGDVDRTAASLGRSVAWLYQRLYVHELQDATASARARARRGIRRVGAVRR